MIYNDNSSLKKTKNQYYINNIDTSVNKYTSYTNYNKNNSTKDYECKDKLNSIAITFKRESNRKNSPK
tara:strand:- start:195 stop:398 length:204 start_codon:yes stop_codon:yes gene_type:complete